MTEDRSPIAPHGGSLVDLLVTGADAEALSDEAGNLPLLTIGERELSDLEMLATGALSPLTGFQSEDDYHSILETMHLTDGLAWAIPVVLGVADDEVHRIGGGGGRRPRPPGRGPPPRRSRSCASPSSSNATSTRRPSPSTAPTTWSILA
jgi:hypothetical protein